jgi:2-succinyl-5-enolpyruvyl-6-hydroxy-3-cyclohexene-1-carboxylate synthase
MGRRSAGGAVIQYPRKETSVFDTVLYAASEKELEELTPDLVITLGGHIVSSG